MNKPKIAVIGLKGLPAFGGAAAVGENIIEQLCSDYEFVVYAVSSHTRKNLSAIHGIKQIVWPALKISKLNILFYYLRSACHCLFQNYDLVHLHHRDASFIMPLLRLKYSVVLTTHGMVLTEKWQKFSLFFQLQDKLFLCWANAITCVSRKDLKIVSQFKKKNVYYIPNGAKPNKIFRPVVLAQKIVFAAGRIVPSKGCHVLLKAVSSIPDFHQEIEVIGDQQQMSDYSKTLEQLSASLNVNFRGLIKDKNELLASIGNALFFIFPSAIESMSMMLLEVASVGVPIIASDIPENKAVFDASQVLFFETNNVVDLTDKIQFALEHPKEMQQKAAYALEKLEQDYDWQKISQSYKKVFEQLLRKNRG